MLIEVPKALLDRALTALQDAEHELEAIEHEADWYTASPKMMSRIETSIRELKLVTE